MTTTTLKTAPTKEWFYIFTSNFAVVNVLLEKAKICNPSIHFQMKIRQINYCYLQSTNYAELSHFTLLLKEPWGQLKCAKFYDAHTQLLFCGILVAVTITLCLSLLLQWLALPCIWVNFVFVCFISCAFDSAFFYESVFICSSLLAHWARFSWLFA